MTRLASDFDYSVGAFTGHQAVPGSYVPVDEMLLLKVVTAMSHIQGYLHLLSES